MAACAPSRDHRLARLGALGIAVLALHLGLLAWAVGPREWQRGAASRALPMPALTLLPSGRPAPAASPVPSPQSGPAVPLPSPGRQEAAETPVRPAAPARSAPASPVSEPAPTVLEVDAVADAAPVPTPSATPGEAPPVYATKLPAPARLRFDAWVNGLSTAAELAWQHDGERYRLDLNVRGPRRDLLEQRSEGRFDAAGVAPERFTDRRRGRWVGAAHFRRDDGRITFSGPALDYPAWPGAQDRLAWLPQIVAVLAAAAEPPAELRFFVADARGVARDWVFRGAGRETVDTADGPVSAWKYQRDPPRPDDLRVAVWLDPAAGFWPVRVDYGVPISGMRLSLTRRAGEAAASPPGP